MDTPPHRLSDKDRPHYGWVIALTGMLTVFASLGLGRFALGMLLPPMGEGLNLSYDEMGMISSGNLLGYLFAVLLSSYGVSRLGFRTLISAALLSTGVSILMVSLSESFLQALLFYFAAGMGSGASNVPVMALTANWFSRKQRGKASALMVAGNGFAIMVSGLAIPLVIVDATVDGWRSSWMLIGFAIIAVSFLSGVLLRNEPREMGLKPLGAGLHSPADPAVGTAGRDTGSDVIWKLGGIYFLFGASYVIYTTFLVTSLIEEHHLTIASAGYHWFGIGAMSILFTPVFGILSDYKGRGYALTIVFALQASAYLLMSLDTPQTLKYLSLILFGISTWSIPSIVAAAVSDHTSPGKVVSAFGRVTLLFGIGQVTGPAVAGLVAQYFEGFSVSFLIACLLATTALGLSISLRRVYG